MAAVLLAASAAGAYAVPGPPSGIGRGQGGHVGRGLVRPTGFERQTSVSHTQVTESPSTHKKGEWWAEVGVVGYSRDASDTLDAQSVEYAPVSAGYAFSDNFEITGTVSAYGEDRVRQLATDVLTRTTNTGGFGVHAKVRWFGTDSSAWSIGTTFTATRPARTDTTSPGAEFGVRVPVAVALPGDVTLGAMLESDLRNDPGGSGQHAEWIQSLALSRDLLPTLSGYVEVLHVNSSLAGQPSLVALDAGFDWTPVPHVGIGLGGSLGQSAGHRDNGVFGGISISR